MTLASYWAEAAGTFTEWRGRTTESAVLAPIARPRQGDAVALVERHDGFYALFAEGELRGPVQPSRAGDLPILSGAAAQTAGAQDLVATRPRWCAPRWRCRGWSPRCGWMATARCHSFFDRSHTELRVDLDDAPAQLKRATEVLGQWRGQAQLIAMVDMTTPGQAVMRLRATAPLAAMQGPGAVRRIAERTRPGGGIRVSGGGRR